MAGAKILDTISEFLGVVGEASDAVSSCTQVEMIDAPRVLKLSGDECPETWIKHLPRQRPKVWNNIVEPVSLKRVV